jgi:hypothetical protein
MTSERKIHPEFTIEKDKATNSLWVNGPANCLGRFTPMGFEIFRELKEGESIPDVMSGNVLDVQMKNTTLVHWNNFRMLMEQHHGIKIDETEYPGEM